MIKKLQRDSNTITIAVFWENHELNKYNFTPPYQRKSIWSDEKQSFLIDSILRNFPIPPVFLHQKIDSNSGHTKYEVIDGKQRLTSIVRFIRNEIPVSSEFDSYESDRPNLAGKFFSDLNEKEFAQIKQDFWRYSIPVESLDTTDAVLIDDIFDRLNRNGEPLTGQELRNAKFHESVLLQEVIKLSQENFWKNRLKNLDLTRMEDIEFISELVFSLIEGGPLDATSTVLDTYYDKYSKDPKSVLDAVDEFRRISENINQLNIDFETFKISGVSHLYGIWSFALYCHRNNFDISKYKAKLVKLFEELRDKSTASPVKLYKETMSSRTKSKTQRVKRLDAILNYCGLKK